MTIERTELAVHEYRAKTSEIVGMVEWNLGAAMAEACALGDEDTVARIKAYLHGKQAWRQS